MTSRDCVTQMFIKRHVDKKYYLCTKNICFDRSIVMKSVNSLVDSSLRQWLNPSSVLAVSCYNKRTPILPVGIQPKSLKCEFVR